MENIGGLELKFVGAIQFVITIGNLIDKCPNRVRDIWVSRRGRRGELRDKSNC
jgi:hypothetical protein